MARVKASDGRRRGSALLFTLLIVAVLAVLAFGIVQMGAGETDAAGAKRRYDRQVSCTDAAKDLLMSKFRMYGASPSSVTINNQVDDQLMTSGHYGQLAIASVSPASGYSGGGIGMSDISNRIAKVGMGGTVYRMTVVCSSAGTGLDAATRQSEVEFVVRFGL